MATLAAGKLSHCAEIVLKNVNYADCDGIFKYNDTKPEGCDGCTKQPSHWSRAGARQLWWCGKGDDDPAGKYSCTPFDTTSCGGSFGSAPTSDVSCNECLAGWEGAGCNRMMVGWGGALLIALVVGGLAYVGGGVAVGVKSTGAAPGLAVHPHRKIWAELAGLVRDGVVFSRTRLRKHTGIRVPHPTCLPGGLS